MDIREEQKVAKKNYEPQVDPPNPIAKMVLKTEAKRKATKAVKLEDRRSKRFAKME